MEYNVEETGLQSLAIERLLERLPAEKRVYISIIRDLAVWELSFCGILEHQPPEVMSELNVPRMEYRLCMKIKVALSVGNNQVEIPGTHATPMAEHDEIRVSYRKEIENCILLYLQNVLEARRQEYLEKGMDRLHMDFSCPIYIQSNGEDAGDFLVELKRLGEVYADVFRLDIRSDWKTIDQENEAYHWMDDVETISGDDDVELIPVDDEKQLSDAGMFEEETQGEPMNQNESVRVETFAGHSDVIPNADDFEIVDGTGARILPIDGFQPEMGLELYSEREDRVKKIPYAERIAAGRSSDCQIRFEKREQNSAISRVHAFFQLDRGDWLIWDNHSSNGTWLNGMRLEQGEKYVLNINDEIDFAHAEKLVFFKNGMPSLAQEELREPNIAVKPDQMRPDENEIKQKKKICEPEDLIGNVIGGRYKIIRLLNKNGVDNHYLVEDFNLHGVCMAHVTYKEEKHKFLFDLMRDRVRIEGRLSHPNIPRIFDFYEDEELAAVIVEFVSGDNLDHITARQGLPMPQNLIVRIGIQMADILSYLHGLNPPVIHRDVKPQNIMWDEQGKFWLVDFGIAMEYHPAREDITILGTRGYAAPEQYTGHSEPRTDIFALGMTLHYLCTGIDPRKEPWEPGTIRDVNPKISKGLAKIIEKCINPNPEKRYPSAAVLKRDLEKIMCCLPADAEYVAMVEQFQRNGGDLVGNVNVPTKINFGCDEEEHNIKTDVNNRKKEMVMVCPQCGKTIPTSDKFCRYCGKHLEVHTMKPIKEIEVMGSHVFRGGKMIYSEFDNPYETVEVYLLIRDGDGLLLGSYVSDYDYDGGSSWYVVYLNKFSLDELEEILKEEYSKTTVEKFLRTNFYSGKDDTTGFVEFLKNRAIAYESKVYM